MPSHDYSPESRAHVRINAAATSQEPGHRYSDTPYTGEALAHALESLRAQIPVSPVQTIFTGINGESFFAKKMGVMAARHSDILKDVAWTEHPADAIGDIGAATAPMLMAFADFAIKRGARPSPVLVTASSDHELRGAVWMSGEASES